MARPQKIHRLRSNETTWTPPTVAFFDTETRDVEGTEPLELELRCWAAALFRRRPEHGAKPVTLSAQGTTAEHLTDVLEHWCIGERTVWVYAHNLGFDLTVTNLVERLGARGWDVTRFSISSDTPWFRLRKGSKALCLTDSWSWLPRALKLIGDAIGLAKLALPDTDDSPEAWAARCMTDVAITAAAVLELMAWWDREQLGRWSITGAATGWNAYRHRPLLMPVTIDPNDEARAFERRAIYGGRRDCWRVGTFEHGPYAELDFANAYATVAATTKLPAQRVLEIHPGDDWHPWVGRDGWGLIAEARVAPTEPRYPLRWRGATWYPQGRFWTILAGPELAVAERRGELEDVGHGWLYRCSGHMKDWGLWLLGIIGDETGQHPEVAKIAAKHWGRAVVGHWAARSHEITELGVATHPGWHLERGYNLTKQCRGARVELNGKAFWVDAHLEGENSFPAVLTWVESEVRVALAAMIDHLPPSCLVTADTDSVIVDLGRWLALYGRARPDRRRRHAWSEVAATLCRDLAELTAPLEPRLKRLADDLVVMGPQHLEARDWRKLAGVKHGATQVAPHTYSAQLFPTLAWQMEKGRPDRYVSPRVTQLVHGPYVSGWVLEDGTVEPVWAEPLDDGTNDVLRYDEHPEHPYAQSLAPTQSPYLQSLI